MLNAVTCVWNEEDIIESSVKHAFAQGCDNVFIVDNGSTDETVKRAERAGAKLAISFKTAFFDEREKIAHLNAVVKHYNALSADDFVWWLYFDADEFPNIDCEHRISDFLNQLGAGIKGVHGHSLDHIPTHSPYHREGFHPIDFMPLCQKSAVTKIPLLRYDKNVPHFFSGGGAHEFDTNGETLPIAYDTLNIHHFPIRTPARTLGRLKRLLNKESDGTSRADWMDRRARALGHQNVVHYNGKYDALKNTYLENENLALKTATIPYDYRNIQRWYAPYSGEQFIGLDDFNFHVSSAVFNFFMQRYEIAICRFNDALDICGSPIIKAWITVKMAECFSHSDKEAAHTLANMAYAFKQEDIRAYIDKNLRPVLDGNPAEDSNGENTPAKNKIVRIEPYCSKFQIDQTPLLRRMHGIMQELSGKLPHSGTSE